MPRLEQEILEDVSILFLSTYSTQTTWRQTVSLANGYGQTFAHISVAFGFLRVLQHLVAWEIDLQVQDDMGLTALHYVYFFQQEESVIFLLRSGATRFVLDHLRRTPSDLGPQLDRKLALDSPGSCLDDHIDISVDMPDEAEMLKAKSLLAQRLQAEGDHYRESVSSRRKPYDLSKDTEPRNAPPTGTFSSPKVRFHRLYYVHKPLLRSHITHYIVVSTDLFTDHSRLPAANFAITLHGELKNFEEIFHNSYCMALNDPGPLVDDPDCPALADKYGIRKRSCYTAFIQVNEGDTYRYRTYPGFQTRSLEEAIIHQRQGHFYYSPFECRRIPAGKQQSLDPLSYSFHFTISVMRDSPLPSAAMAGRSGQDREASAVNYETERLPMHRQRR